jgi:hypothetical protein
MFHPFGYYGCGFEPHSSVTLCFFKLGFSCFPCAWFITNFQYHHEEVFEWYRWASLFSFRIFVTCYSTFIGRFRISPLYNLFLFVIPYCPIGCGYESFPVFSLPLNNYTAIQMLLSDAYQSYWGNYYIERLLRIELRSLDWKSKVITIIR